MDSIIRRRMRSTLSCVALKEPACSRFASRIIARVRALFVGGHDYYLILSCTCICCKESVKSMWNDNRILKKVQQITVCAQMQIYIYAAKLIVYSNNNRKCTRILWNRSIYMKTVTPRKQRTPVIIMMCVTHRVGWSGGWGKGVCTYLCNALAGTKCRGISHLIQIYTNKDTCEGEAQKARRCLGFKEMRTWILRASQL